MTDSSITEYLTTLEIFADLDEDRRNALFATAQRVALDEDEVLFNAGDPPGKLYVVEDGWINIYAGHGDDRIDLAEIGPGGLIGEMGELSQATRSAAAGAAIPSCIIALDGPVFVKTITEHPPTALRVMQMLSRRVSSANSLVLQRSGPLG